MAEIEDAQPEISEDAQPIKLWGNLIIVLSISVIFIIIFILRQQIFNLCQQIFNLCQQIYLTVTDTFLYKQIYVTVTETFPCQLINTITQPFDITIFVYSVLYLCIIIMIGIFLYWDIIYKTAKNYSKCNNISKIIDESVYTETPYVYTIVIINTKRIKKLSEYIIKITYDFNKMDTNIEYGNTEGEDTIFQYRIHDHKAILEEIKILESRETALKALLTRDESVNAELSEIKLRLFEIKNTEEGKIANSLQSVETQTFYASFNYNYLNLTTMKPNIIEDLSTRINSNDYKYYAVDKDFKMIHSYTTSELIKFTKGYSQNENYSTSIIDYILFSKLQRDKNINI